MKSKMATWRDDVGKTFYYLTGFSNVAKFSNMRKALLIAQELHAGQFRKSGAPYLVHPLRVCAYLTAFEVLRDDVLLSAALLHDVVEDVDRINDDPSILVREYGLSQEVLDVVMKLTKREGLTTEAYYREIRKDWRAVMIKISDRCNNVSTLDSFNYERMCKYLEETREHVLPLLRFAKHEYCAELANAVTVMKYQITAICTSVENCIYPPDELAKLKAQQAKSHDDEIATWRDDASRTYYFLSGIASRGCYENMRKALFAAESLHRGQKRKGGAEYLVHPLRVCSYLYALCEGFRDDVLLAAALLHDVVEDVPEIKENPMILVKEYGISREVLAIVMKLTKREGLSDKSYFDGICSDWRALMIKLSDRCNNVSTLDAFTYEKMALYIEETREKIVPLTRYSKAHYPQYNDMVTIMKYHITAACTLIENINRLEELETADA